MFRSVLLAGLAAAAFVPSLAQAQSQDSRQRCLEQKHDNRVVGTVLGGIGGALLGNAIGEHGGREGGTILGGLGGAVAGHEIAKRNCGETRAAHDCRWTRYRGLSMVRGSSASCAGPNRLMRDRGRPNGVGPAACCWWLALALRHSGRVQPSVKPRGLPRSRPRAPAARGGPQPFIR